MPRNTLLLRLAGPMQAWGTGSRFQLRRTDRHPSRSGVLGLLLCARGVERGDSKRYLNELAPLAMGVRIDNPGIVGQDYHTVGARVGIRQAKDGRIKYTDKTHKPETLLSRRQYLYGASFLVALQGAPELIAVYEAVLQAPVWPPYLGRKCCIPSHPIFAGTGSWEALNEALSSAPLEAMNLEKEEKHRRDSSVERLCWMEAEENPAPGDDIREVYDVPRRFGYWDYGARRIVESSISVEVRYPESTAKSWRDPYGKDWDEQRRRRLEYDRYLCVFCQSPATQVHHTDYDDVHTETLRSLCELCHDACTMIEYSRGDKPQRVDPTDAKQQERLLAQIERILKGRRKSRRRDLLREH